MTNSSNYCKYPSFTHRVFLFSSEGKKRDINIFPAQILKIVRIFVDSNQKQIPRLRPCIIFAGNLFFAFLYISVLFQKCVDYDS